MIESMLSISYSPIKFPETQMCEDLIRSRNYSPSKLAVSETQVPEFVRGKVVDLKIILELYQQCEQLQKAYATLGNEVSMQRHVIEQLYGEIQGVFYRSMVPPKDRPPVLREMNQVLDEKLAKEIFSLKGVVSAGYRFSTLNIFLDALMSEDENEITQNDLTRLLNGHNVLKYMFCYEQNEITQFRKVGSRIKVHNEQISEYLEGSLGGFAKLGADKETCVLLAKHLADQSTSSCIYIKDYPNTEEILPFAFLLHPKIPVDRNVTLDIALAKVIPSELNKCQTRFKDEYGTSLPSTLCLFQDLAWLNGLDVHIWRAGSSPGLGVIVIPSLYVKDMEDTFLKIEDREPDVDQQITRFAKEGDSGAVVCATDINRSTVHVLAMLIGSSNHYQVTRDPTTKQQYVAFRLLNGLQQLRQEQKNDVTLY